MSDNVLFVCVENAGRSQMAEAFFRKYAPDSFSAISAGTTPSSQVNPLVVQVMDEVGIDVTKQIPKILSDYMIRDSVKVINMGCMDKESCPSLFVDDVVDWNVSDPKGKSVDEIRKIRDSIKSQVMDLVCSIEENN